MLRKSKIEALDLPDNYKENLKKIKEKVNILGDSVNKVILFGSCSRGNFNKNSDIDILILTNIKINQEIEDEFIWRLYNFDNNSDDITLPLDIIIQDIDTYNKCKGQTGLVQKAIEREGVEII